MTMMMLVSTVMIKYGVCQSQPSALVIRLMYPLTYPTAFPAQILLNIFEHFVFLIFIFNIFNNSSKIQFFYIRNVSTFDALYNVTGLTYPPSCQAQIIQILLHFASCICILSNFRCMVKGGCFYHKKQKHAQLKLVLQNMELFLTTMLRMKNATMHMIIL